MTRYALPITLALILVVGIGYFIRTEPAKLISPIDVTKASLAEIEKLKGRTIVDFGEGRDGTISYSYLADPVPEVLAEQEITELRTENSYTVFEKVLSEGENPVVQLSSRFFSQPAFAQDVDGTWRTLEYATTTRQAFEARSQTLWQRIAEVFVRTAYADSISPFSGAGDGYIGMNAACTSDPIEFDPCPCDTWTDTHDALTGNSSTDVSTTMLAYMVNENYTDVNNFGSCSTAIYRVFLPFDTSAISASATVSAASLNVYVVSKANGLNDGYDYLTVVQSGQASHTALATSDYDQCGAISSPTEGIDTGEREDITSLATSAYLVLTLNSTGRGWVKKSGESSNCTATAGITCLGVREGHDSANVNNTATGVSTFAQFQSSETTGTSQDPYLSVTYSVDSATVRGSMKVTGAGFLKVVSGGLKIR